jgi:hypothetical protein
MSASLNRDCKSAKKADGKMAGRSDFAVNRTDVHESRFRFQVPRFKLGRIDKREARNDSGGLATTFPRFMENLLVDDE